MKLTTEDIVDDKNLIGHMVLNALSKDFEMIDAITAKGYATLKLTVNDKEIDIKVWADHWQSQVERMIRNKAIDLINNKFCNIEYKIEALKKELINSITDSDYEEE